VIADGFYEWKARAGKKQLVRITLASGAPFSFAGLWDGWKAPGGEPIRACTIITTTPNELMANIHNRMPVMLHSEAEKVWLDPEVQDHGLSNFRGSGPFPRLRGKVRPVLSLSKGWGYA
jgi:putative SOS response-associated peptidase YedK